ncbi:uncharacterized protein KGF55_005321 [Candida pseudojiufengensis]|uniref:uncharacterized protein n=1 Tax=Candida pseudojiufengensis TaxID=497109 RepID=UPI002225083E|nr:uncharacterized protein KGF55_005321 [Candida pseudojiufengensis]KAI5959493.1 hypothetical protein KGF55_005321 [Candida pseudojiufengensis]
MSSLHHEEIDQNLSNSPNSTNSTTQIPSNSTISSNNYHHINNNHNKNNYHHNSNNYNNENNNHKNNFPNLPSLPENPFSNIHINSYSHKPNVVPVYVLDSISKKVTYEAKHNQNINQPNLQNNNDNDIGEQQQQQLQQLQQESSTHQQDSKRDKIELSFRGQNDPYLNSINGDWNLFFNSIQQPISYPKDYINIDPNILNEYNLNKEWGGDERLKKEFNNEDSANKQINESSTSKSFWHFISNTKDDGEHDSKIRKTTAGYWMGSNRSNSRPAMKHFLLNGPLIPLMLRIITLIFCTIALGLACTIFVFSNDEYNGRNVSQQASTIMAICVQSCAILYVIYIAYDEYAGKPLGLRKPMSKIRLILLDLLFIIFSAANLSLAFNTLYDDEWVCEIYRSNYQDVNNYFPVISSICRRQRALASFLFVKQVCQLQSPQLKFKIPVQLVKSGSVSPTAYHAILPLGQSPTSTPNSGQQLPTTDHGQSPQHQLFEDPTINTSTTHAPTAQDLAHNVSPKPNQPFSSVEINNIKKSCLLNYLKGPNASQIFFKRHWLINET